MIQASFDTLMTGIQLFAIAQGIVLMFLLLKVRKGNQVGHRMLAWLIFIAVVNLVSSVFVSFDFDRDFLIQFMSFSFACSLAAPPLIYFYTRLVTNNETQMLYTQWIWHFLPSLLYLFVFVPYVMTVHVGEANSFAEMTFAHWVVYVSEIFFLVQFLVYIVLSMRWLRRHHHNIEHMFSATERINLNWLRNVLVGFSLIYAAYFFSLMIPETPVIHLFLDNMLKLLIVILIYTLGYLGMHQADIFGKEAILGPDEPLSKPIVFDANHMVNIPNQTLDMCGHHIPEEISGSVDSVTEHDNVSKALAEEIDKPNLSEESPQPTEKLETEEVKAKEKEIEPQDAKQKEKQEQQPKKYQKSALDNETSKLLFDDLLIFMEEKKPYLENDISLSGLAKQVNLSPNYLSQVINEQSKNNFFDFINRYRVGHFKTRLAEQLNENNDTNMIDMAMASGFNSKSAFYKAFKKYEGMTPSQYKKSISSR